MTWQTGFLLGRCGHAPLVETEACPRLTAVGVATVGAIFVALDESLEHLIDNEFELPDRFFFRNLIPNAIP